MGTPSCREHRGVVLGPLTPQLTKNTKLTQSHGLFWERLQGALQMPPIEGNSHLAAKARFQRPLHRRRHRCTFPFDILSGRRRGFTHRLPRTTRIA